MKIFILDKTNSRFVDVRKDFFRVFRNDVIFVYDHQITHNRIVRWIETNQLAIDSNHQSILYTLWSFLGKPHRDFNKWLQKLSDDVEANRDSPISQNKAI